MNYLLIVILCVLCPIIFSLTNIVIITYYPKTSKRWLHITSSKWSQKSTFEVRFIIKSKIKNLTDTIKKKFGKGVRKPSRAEIMADEYRAKRGLPPVKKKK